LDKLIHELRAIASVAIEKHDNLAFRGKSANASRAGASVTALWLRNYPRARGARSLGCSIAAAVINDDDLARDICGGDCSDNRHDRLFFVQRRNNYRKVHFTARCTMPLPRRIVSASLK